MKKIIIISIILTILTSCTTTSVGVINSKDFFINPFDSLQYNVSWES